MTDFSPGDGWREVAPSEAGKSWPLIHLHQEDGSTRYWIPEKPVAPLPTEPHTVIRAWVEGADEPRVYVLNEGGVWFRAGKTSTLRAPLNYFEVLSRPVVAGGIALEAVQRETAKAVLDTIMASSKGWNYADIALFADVAAKFGVQS